MLPLLAELQGSVANSLAVELMASPDCWTSSTACIISGSISGFSKAEKGTKIFFHQNDYFVGVCYFRRKSYSTKKSIMFTYLTPPFNEIGRSSFDSGYQNISSFGFSLFLHWRFGWDQSSDLVGIEVKNNFEIGSNKSQKLGKRTLWWEEEEDVGIFSFRIWNSVAKFAFE